MAQTRREQAGAAGPNDLAVQPALANTMTKRTTATIGYDYLLSRRSDLYVSVMRDRATGVSSGTSFGLDLRHRF
jgi:predicted porin